MLPFPLLILCLSLFQTPSPSVVQERWDDGTLRLEYEAIPGEDGAVVRHGSIKQWRADGSLAAKGRYRKGERNSRWYFYFKNGEIQSKGVYKKDLQHGTWHFFFASGAKKERGDFKLGHRVEFWQAWTEDGPEDPLRSGEYQYQAIPYPSGVAWQEGYLLNGLPQGAWRFWWESGQPQMMGEFLAGARHGRWSFWHMDGAPDLEMQAGIYAFGVRLRSATESLLLAEMEWPEPSMFPKGDSIATFTGPTDRNLYAKELWATGFAESDEDNSQKVKQMIGYGKVAIPVLLKDFASLDLQQAGSAVHGAFVHAALAGIFHGEPGAWSLTEGARGLEQNQSVIRKWMSLWQQKQDDALFWDFVLATRGRVSNAYLLEGSTRPVLTSKIPPKYTLRLEEHEAGEREQAVELSLGWLVQNQAADGHWSRRYPDHQEDQHDVGVTSLALLALLGHGNTLSDGPYQGNLRRGVAWLLQQQCGDGYIGRVRGVVLLNTANSALHIYPCTACEKSGLMECGSCHGVGRTFEGASCATCEGDAVPCTSCNGKGEVWRTGRSDDNQEVHLLTYTPDRVELYGHAMATIVLCEASVFSPDVILRDAAQQAVHLILAAQDQYSGWGYGLVAAEVQDVSISNWMVSALLAAQDAHLEVPQQAFVQVTTLFDSLTNRNTGRVAYSLGAMKDGSFYSSRGQDFVDTFPAERGEALTAATLWSKLNMAVLGESRQWQDHPEFPEIQRRGNLVLSKLPYWNTKNGSIDLYYWYFGALALHEVGGESWSKWSKALDRALLPSQRSKQDDPKLAGSWDPIGAWGSYGGRVYSTAMAAMALEAEYRFRPRFH